MLPTGEITTREGFPSSTVFVIINGRVKLTVISDNGVETCLDYIGGGDLIGVEGVFDDGPCTVTATAVSDTTVRAIPQPVFQQILRELPDVAYAVSRSLVEQLRRSTLRRAEFGSYPVLTRVARVLLDLVERDSYLVENDRRLRITQRELAGLVGATEPSVQRAVSALRRYGAIRTGYREMTVRNIFALRQIALTDELLG
jgi:CRP-like cAMP-binding protein